MARDRDWDFGESKKSTFSYKTVLILIYGLVMAIIGGYIAYALLWSSLAKMTVETAAIPEREVVYTSELVVQAVEKIKDSVVGVVNLSSSTTDGEVVEYEEGTGSGIIYEVNGLKAYVVTNYHVISGASSVEVVSSDGVRVTARVVGYDDLNDLAVLEIPSKMVKKVAKLGDSEKIRVGETVIAVGNPLGLAYSETVTVGVVSGKNRTLPTFFDGDDFPDWEVEVIQTDAAINFGNSGGALLNLQGEVIGINSAKIVEAGVESIGFSIPIHVAKPIMEEIVQHGKIRRPYLGIIPVDLTAVPEERLNLLDLPAYIEEGVLLWEEPEGPSLKAGLRMNDVIVAIDGMKISSQLQLRKTLYSHKIGDVIEIDFYRKGKRLTTRVTLAEMPEK